MKPKVVKTEEPRDLKQPKVVKKIGARTLVLVASAGGVAFGLFGFIVYFFTQNMVIGVPAVLIGVAGAFIFKYYWDKGGELVAEHIGEVPKEQVDSLNIYKDRVVFENYPHKEKPPAGYLMECVNDHKKYWVNISQENYQHPDTALSPFMLPDQQYYDPRVFAERVISLPNHRRIFRRRDKPGQTIKTILLVVTILVLWLLIITTTT